MKDAKTQVLARIAKPFNDSGITWGVGASMLLAQYNLVDSPSDIDIIVGKNDIYIADGILSAFGVKKIVKEKSEIYSTDFFYEYNLDTIEIDIMAGFKINLPDSVFEYLFDKHSVPHSFTFGATEVPFMTLEEWYVLYQLMPGREYKVNLIESYFGQNGIEYPQLIVRLCDNKSLPLEVEERCCHLLQLS